VTHRSSRLASRWSIFALVGALTLAAGCSNGTLAGFIVISTLLRPQYLPFSVVCLAILYLVHRAR
jgi:H+/Cl- antiporter ClcA